MTKEFTSGSISFDAFDTAGTSAFFGVTFAVDEAAAFFGVADFEADFIAKTIELNSLILFAKTNDDFLFVASRCRADGGIFVEKYNQNSVNIL